MRRIQLSSTFLSKRTRDIEELIPCSTQTSPKSPWSQPGSFLERVEPYIPEFAGAWPEKPDLEQGHGIVRGDGSASADSADAGLCGRQQRNGQAVRARTARVGRHPSPAGKLKA